MDCLEESIFDAARQLADPGERTAYLNCACRDNHKLQARIELLLSAYGDGAFLESPPGNLAATAELSEIREQPGATVGPYKLLEQIGEGGMGLVFMAEQSQPLRRRVALKVIKPGLDTRAVIARFEAERQALALMDHPNIARVYDAGATESGRPYFVMELVRGAPITDYCRDRNLSLRERLELFIDVCQAVQHAHQKGMIHRDLKPTNILVSQTDTAPVPKVIDFGVAKATSQPLTERTLFTHFSQIIGTPLYMSPEQADLGNQDVDTRSDVYSLGVVLYELLTGTTPFDAQRLRSVSHDEMRRIIREEEPPKPSTRSTTEAVAITTVTTKPPIAPQFTAAALKGDLDWIVMKALDKDRRRRYESPSTLAADLQRFLERQPVHARPPSYRDKLAKWSRRHVGLVWSALAASLFVAAASGMSAIMIGESRDEANEHRQIAVAERNAANAERNSAITQRNRARRNQYYAEIVASQIEVEQQNIVGARATLAGHLPLQGRQDNRGWEWYYLLSRCHPELRTLRDSTYSFAAWSPDGKLIGGPGVVWEDRTAARLVNISPARILRKRVAWSPDGRKLAWGMASDDNGIYIWDRPTNAVERLGRHDASVWCLDWSPDGTKLASGAIDNTIKIWDVAARSVIRTIPTTGGVMNVAWRPDGELLAATVGGVRAFNPGTGEQIAEFTGPRGAWSIDWSPDGRQLFVENETAWQVLSGDDLSVERKKHPLFRGGGAISCSPDGTKLAVTHGESITIWDLKMDRPIADLLGHLSEVVSVAWSPDGNRLITSSDEGEVKTWSLAEATAPAPPHLHAPISSVQWQPDDETITATSHSEGVSFAWKPGISDPVRRNLETIEGAICTSADGSVVAVYRPDGSSHTIDIIDVATKETRAVLPLPADQALFNSKCALSGDGSRCAVVTRSGNQMFLTGWDVHGEHAISTWQWVREELAAKAEKIAWSPDGKLLSVITFGDKGDNGSTYWGDHLNVIDAATGRRIFKHYAPGRKPITALSWNPSSPVIALGTEEGRVEVVDAAAQRVVFSQKIHADTIYAIAWRPDSARLACSSVDGIIKLITASAGQPLLTFTMAERSGSYLAWSADGHRLAAVSSEGAVQMWDATRGYDISAGGKRRGELAWAYFDRARATTGEEARRALREALRNAPDTLDFWNLRGSICAILGENDRAAEEFAKLAAPDFRWHFEDALDLARCLMAAGREAEYQQICSGLVSTFSDDEIQSNRHFVIERSFASPNSSVDPDVMLRMARDSRGEEDLDVPHGEDIYIGASLLRAAKYEEASRLLTECVERAPSGPDETGNGELATMKYFLALARCRLGHIAQARRLLAEANEHSSRAGDLQWNWRLRIDLEALRKEVEVALRQ